MSPTYFHQNSCTCVVLYTNKGISVCCRILGAVLIMLGLYIVLWGKSEEKRIENQEREDTLTKHLLSAETCIQRQDTGSLSSDIP